MAKPQHSEDVFLDKPENSVRLEKVLSQDDRDHITREAIGGDSTADLPPHYYRSPAFIGTFLSIGLAYQGAFLFYNMVAGQLQIINADIGPSLDIIWVLLVYVLCQTMVFTISGRMSDIFGRPWFFIAANLLAFAGYMIGGRAQSVNALIGASVAAGFGSGVQQTMPVLMGELVPNRHRPMTLAATFVLLGPVSSISPGLARVMSIQASWRWVYYTAAISSALAALLQLLFYHPPHFKQLHTKLSKIDALKRLDWAGIVIFAASVTSIILGVSWGGQKYPWNSPHVIGSIVAGGAGLIIFGLWEIFGPVPEPLIPFFLFKTRNYVVLALVATIGCVVYFALSVIWPTQLLTVYGVSPISAGWMTCTLSGGAVFGQVLSMGTARLTRFFSTKWQLVFSCVIFTTFGAAMAKLDDGNIARAVVFSLLSSMMIGWMEVITIAGAPLAVDPEYIGVATGAAYTFRGMFSALAVSIYVTILQNALTSNSVEYLVPALVDAGLPPASVPGYIASFFSGDLATLAQVPGFSPDIVATTAPATFKVFTKSYSLIYLASISFGIVSIIASLLMDGKTFDAGLTPTIARRLQNVEKENSTDGNVSEA